jgi:hypothetical protein
MAGMFTWALLSTTISLSPGQYHFIYITVPEQRDRSAWRAAPGINGKQFFNMEGPANGTLGSFGVVDFQSRAVTAQIIR